MPLLHWLTREEDILRVACAPYRPLEEAPDVSYGDRDTGNLVLPQEILPKEVKLKRLGLEAIMGKQRQKWSVEEKWATVLAVLSERQSVAEVARQRGVNENQVYRWKEQFLTGGWQGLNGAKSQTADQRLEAENNQLKILLGERALEIEILKALWRI